MSYMVGFVRPRSLSIVGVTDSLVSVVRQSPLSSLHVRNRKRGVLEKFSLHRISKDRVVGTGLSEICCRVCACYCGPMNKASRLATIVILVAFHGLGAIRVGGLS